MIARREFGRRLAAWIGGAALGGLSCTSSLTREEVLRDLVQQVVLPDVQSIARESRTLDRDLSRLVRDTSPQAVGTARASLRRSMLAWQRAQAFREGPMLETHALIRSTFWPVRRTAIAQTIRSGQSFDAARVSELGVDLKGVFALEHLLFEGPTVDTSWLSAAEAPAALAYAHAIAREVSVHADHALHAFEGGAVADRFAHGGQASLNRLVNHMLASMETIAADRLGRVLARRTGQSTSVQDIQGGASGVSTDLALAWLTATRSLFDGRDGRGVATLVKHAAPAIEPALRAAFARAVDELSRVPKRWDADSGALERSIQAIKELEVATRVDLVAALGVSLSFISTDGD